MGAPTLSNASTQSAGAGRVDLTKPAVSRSLRAVFWLIGVFLASAAAWVSRFQTSADSISYLDMSDGVMPGGDWHRLINGTWSPLYALLLGLFRRAFGIPPAQEIVAAHVLNIIFFVLAFVCFEFFLASLMRRMSGAVVPGETALPWLFPSLAYSLFIWSSVSAIALEYLRPDMLMSCFVYLAMGMLLNLADREADWSAYLVLGMILGIAFLAKAPMLPMSVVILGVSLFLVKNWRPALKMAAVSFAIVLCIGALYFAPLSRARGKFTLGESGAYNYLVNVDRAGAGWGWYLVDPGHGSGKPLHPPQLIFSLPPVYAFSQDSLVTHPLRFEPSWWMQGLHARIAVKRQIGESLASFVDLGRSLVHLAGAIALILLLALMTSGQGIQDRFVRAWPVPLIGVAGCGMYLAVHLEARYVGVFLTLFFCALLSCFLPPRKAGKIAAIVTIVVVASLLVPSAAQLHSKYLRYGRGPNEDALAAEDLRTLGVQPGDHVGRISRFLTDLAIERIARVEVVTEVDFTRAREFWSAPPEIQNQVLQTMAAHGAKVVIATRPQLTGASQSEWKRLAASDYWVWMPATSANQR